MAEYQRATRPEAQEKDWIDNDVALVKLSSDGKTFPPENFWSLNDAFQGAQVFGGTGSGKSSGSGQAIARAFLRSNLGGLVLTAKTDEVHAWEQYAEATGRTEDLIIVNSRADYRFNFLSYELKRKGVGGGQTENLVNLFSTVLEAAERKQGGGGGNDSYWQRTLKQLLRNAIDLSVIAFDNFTLPELHRIITSAAKTIDETADTHWQKESYCYKALKAANERAKTIDRVEDMRLTADYWMNEYPSLAPETRSVIVSTFTSMADCFLRGTLRKLFCTDTNFEPDDTFEGKIIILNLPVKEHNELGQFAQVLFKYIWQRAVERRIPNRIDRKLAEQTIRPVFLWADESQFFANSYDALFQSTARSSRACTVYLTQNLPSYFAAFGGANSRAEVEAFVGNLQTKIFHANGDPTTNDWAAASIGKVLQIRYGGGLSAQMGRAGGPGGMQQSSGGQQQVDFLVQPQEFTILSTGGEDFDYKVDAIVFQGGRRWKIGGQEGLLNFIHHRFVQIYEGHPH